MVVVVVVGRNKKEVQLTTAPTALTALTALTVFGSFSTRAIRRTSWLMRTRESYSSLNMRGTRHPTQVPTLVVAFKLYNRATSILTYQPW